MITPFVTYQMPPYVPPKINRSSFFQGFQWGYSPTYCPLETIPGGMEWSLPRIGVPQMYIYIYMCKYLYMWKTYMPFDPIISHYPISGWNSAVTAVACGLAEAINRNDAALLAEATDLGAHRLLRQRCALLRKWAWVKIDFQMI